MIVIYSPASGKRLEYVLDYICSKRWGQQYVIVTSSALMMRYEGAYIINYSDEELAGADVQIRPHGLLFEKGIRLQAFHVHRWKKTIIPFYNAPGQKIPFDVLSAVFYYLTRYEEYLEGEVDRHGRFPASRALSYTYHSLHQPVVDIWLQSFKHIILKSHGHMPFREEKYEKELTFDIDLLYKYKFKSTWKTLGGTVKDFARLDLGGVNERQQVLVGKKNDPFLVFEDMNALLLKNKNIKARYFLLTKGDTAFDKMHDLNLDIHQAVIRRIDADIPVHIHPSYYSSEHGAILSEKEYLEHILGKKVQHSRQHFIKISFPETYRQLIAAGISHDHTMGFPQQNGFRAGTSRPFLWYDLERDEKTGLTVHPFAWMDATALYYGHRKKYKELFMEWSLINDPVQKTGGTMTSIFHNYIIGDRRLYPDFWQLFATVVSG